MKCVVCKINEAETTDCRCKFCVGRPIVFGNKQYDNGCESGEITKEDEINFYKKVFEK